MGMIFNMQRERVDGPVKGVIEVLEEALEHARKGDFIAVSVAAVTSDNTLTWQREDGGRWGSLLAAVAASQHDMFTEAERM